MATFSDPEIDDAQQKQLIAEFGDRVEESLILLFLREQGLATARQTLADIAENVRLEEASGFDAGGVPGGAAWDNVTVSASVSDSIVSDSVVSGTSAATEESIAAQLQSAFPMLRPTEIRRVLQQAGDDVDKASDILLNLGHLEETGQRPKGIDGFFRPEDGEEGTVVPPGPLSRSQRRRQRKKSSAAASQAGSAGDKNQQLALDHRRVLTPLAVDATGVLRDEDEYDNNPASPWQTVVGNTPPSRDRQALEASEAAAHEARQASSASFAAAGAAFRRGRSDPLFRQAAVVYAERGHALARQARQSESAAADARVAVQSGTGAGGDSLYFVDLHYVPVHDGVRIAVDRARRWWAALEGVDRAAKSRAARASPLRIVTGAGVHSPRGYSRMYGEVGSALTRDGWTLQSGTGHYFVTGKKA